MIKMDGCICIKIIRSLVFKPYLTGRHTYLLLKSLFAPVCNQPEVFIRACMMVVSPLIKGHIM